MWRFLLSGLCMVGALIVLLAGATGDLHAFPRVLDWWRTAASRAAPGSETTAPPEPAHTPAPALPLAPQPPPPPQITDATEIAKAQAARDAMQRVVADLQSQVEQRTREAASIAADRDRLQKELDALHQRQQARLPAPASRPPPVNTPPQPAFAPGPEDGPSSRQRLMSAQQALVSGRAEDARQMLALAQRQMAFRPVTADRPDPMGTNWPATWVGRAIRSLDMGDTSGALHDIALAIDSS